MAGLARMHASKVNPNDQHGGGGCVCSDTKREGCRGPYVIFDAVSTDSNVSPHVVACRQCLQDALLACSGELLNPTAGDRVFIGEHVMVHENLKDQRIPGYGARDEGYVPVDAEDATLIRDGSPGFYETPVVTPIEKPKPKAEPQKKTAPKAVLSID